MILSKQPMHYLAQELDCYLADFAKAAGSPTAGEDIGYWLWDLEDTENVCVTSDIWNHLGYCTEQMPHLAWTWENLTIGMDHSVLPHRIVEKLGATDTVYDEIIRVINAASRTVHLRCRGTILRDSDGTPIRLFCAISEMSITTSIGPSRSLGALEQALAEKEQINDDLRHLVYSMSHDIMSPLRSIAAALKETRREMDAGRCNDAGLMLELCDASVNRLLGTLRDLKTYFTSSASAQSSLAPVSVKMIASQVSMDLGHLISETKSRVTCDGDHDVVAEPAQLRILLQNLVENAIKFGSLNGPANVQIITSALPDGRIRLSVADDGKGIAEDRLSEIFTPFKRLHNQSEAAGSGLGLAICRKIADNFNASIFAQSHSTGGACFSIDFPAQKVA